MKVPGKGEFTDRFVQSFRNPNKVPEKPKEFRYFEWRTDGLSLMLNVSCTGSLTWHAMFYRGGKSTTQRIGSYDERGEDHLTIKQAREKANRFNAKKVTAAREAGTFE